MKAYFLPLGAGADRSLPAILSAVSCGAARSFPVVRLLRVTSGTPSPLPDAMAADLNACCHFFAGKDAFAFFRTEWQTDVRIGMSWRRMKTAACCFRLSGGLASPSLTRRMRRQFPGGSLRCWNP